jgi:hypothetical protein
MARGHPPSVLSKGADVTWEPSSRGQGSTTVSTTVIRSAGDTGKSDGGKGTLTSDPTGSQPVSEKTDAQGVNGWGSGQGDGWGDSGWSNTPGSDNNDRGPIGNSGWGDSGGGWGASDGNGWGSSGNNEGSRKVSGRGSNLDIGWATKDARSTAPTASSTVTQRGEDETMKNSTSPAVTETMKPSIPLPNRKASSSHLPFPASSMQITDPLRMPLKIRTASIGETVEPSPTIVPASARPRETLTRVQVYSNTIKYVVPIFPIFRYLIMLTS